MSKISTMTLPRRISRYVLLCAQFAEQALILFQELFSRIGRVSKLQLRYDRAGRSDGVAFVIYERKEDATEAIRQFDGANANGSSYSLCLDGIHCPFLTCFRTTHPT